MTIDRDHVVAAAAAVDATPPPGAAGLVGSIHRDPQLREWVPLESGALPPVVWAEDRAWRIASLLAAGADQPGRVRPPWGLVTWSWPDGQVLAFRRLSGSERPSPGWTDQPVRFLGPQAQAFYAELDRVLAGAPAGADLRALADRSTEVLPGPVRELYGRLVPQAAYLAGGVAPPPAAPAAAGPDVERREPAVASLPGWLRDALGLAERFGLEATTASLRALELYLALPGFRLGVVGEFSVGKSQLINQLLGDDVLPTGEVPTTRNAISVVPAAGAESSLEVVAAGGATERRPLDAASWRDLVGPSTDGDPTHPVRVRLANQWLRSTDIEILDTPGGNEGDVGRLDTVATVLANSDAIVMVIRATSPFSRTERAFLEDKLREGRSPQVLVVVSMLDLLRGGPTPVLERIATIARSISSEIVVLPGPGGESAGGGDPERLATIRGTIERFSDRAARRRWRARQVAARVADECGVMVELAAEAEAAAKLDAQARAEAYRRTQEEIADQNRSWQAIQLELDRRRLALTRRLRAQLEAAREDLVERFLLQLAQQQNPKEYWERELPYAMRRELAAAARGIEASIGQAVEADVSWLDAAVRGVSDQPVGRPGAAEPVAEAQFEGRPLDLKDPGRVRIGTRLGTVAGGAVVGWGIASALAFPPMALLAVVGAAMLGDEVLFKRWLEHQRDQVREQLRPPIDRAVDAYVDAVDTRARQLYGSLTDELRARQRNWQRARLDALAVPDVAGDQRPWTELAERAAMLRRRIEELLAKEPEA